MHRDAERAADYRAGVLARPIWNYLRDTKERPEPYTMGEIFPSLSVLEEEAGEAEEMSPEETKAYLLSMMRALGGKPVRRAEA